MSEFRVESLPTYVHKPQRRGAAIVSVIQGGREIAPWTMRAARNGNPILPDEVYQVLLEECAKHPGPARHDTFGIVLNATAWRTRHLGMGLSRKTGGQRVDSPVGEIAEDIICHREGHHWDVLGGAAVGNPLQPGQGPSIGIIDLRARPWVEPVEPASSGGHEPAPPVVTPPVDTRPTPPATVDLSSILAALARIESQGRETADRVARLEGGGALTRQGLNELILGPEVMGYLRQEFANLAGQAGGGERCRVPSWMRSASPAALKAALSSVGGDETE